MRELLEGTMSCPEHSKSDKESREERQIKSYNSAEGKPDIDTGYECPKCKNKGNIAIIKNGYFTTIPCDCLKIRKSLKDLKRSGLGAVNKNTFDNYIITEKWQSDILDKAKAFLKEPMGKWFFIGGQVGAGKTHIGKALAYEYIKRGIYARYMEWRNDVQRLNAAINEPEGITLKAEFLAAPVLYIDDFLKTGQNAAPTQGDINRAIDIIFGRYTQENTVVIISSEKTINEIRTIDEAVGSRIFERSAEYVINIGKDEKKNHRIYSKI